ncbi:MAG: hypothetical protein ACE5F1_12595, partial [Planctomycetota bacterium]
MRTQSLLVVALGLSLAAPVASSPQNTFNQNKLRIWDQTSRFTSRGRLGTAATGFLSQAFPYSVLAGARKLTHLKYVIQTRNLAVRSSWVMRVAGLGANGLPDYVRSTPIAPPVTIGGTGRGAGAFLVTHTFNPPVLITVPAGQWHLCWQLLAANLSILMSVEPTTPQAPCSTLEAQRVERGRPVAEQLAWTQVPNAIPPAAPYGASWRLDLGFDEPMLQGAALVYAGTRGVVCPNNPNTGYASLDPDFANVGGLAPPRFDDYSWTIEAGASYAGGIALLFHSTTVLPAPIALPPVGGALRLDFTDPLIAFIVPARLGASGAARVNVSFGLGASALRSTIVGLPTWSSQALVIDRRGRAAFSNLWTLRPRNLPARFFGGKASITTPLRVARGTR